MSWSRRRGRISGCSRVSCWPRLAYLNQVASERATVSSSVVSALYAGIVMEKRDDVAPCQVVGLVGQSCFTSLARARVGPLEFGPTVEVRVTRPERTATVGIVASSSAATFGDMRAMPHTRPRTEAAPDHRLDYSSPEAQEALEDVTVLIAEIRDQVYRRTALYERTLGLAVVPVLVRRALIVLRRRIRRRGQVAR